MPIGANLIGILLIKRMYFRLDSGYKKDYKKEIDFVLDAPDANEAIHVKKF